MDAYIGGRWAGARSAMRVRDPANGKAVATVARCGPDEVGSAVDAAAGALDGWEGLGWEARCAIVSKLADRMDAQRDGLAAILVREQGKPLAEARSELAFSARCIRYFATLRRPAREVEDGKMRVRVEGAGCGVCALVLPWNYPVGTLSWKLGPALVAGCTVVAKPSPYTPLTALEVARLAHGLVPSGVLNVVPGGDSTGRALAAHPRVDRVAFTGSREAGTCVLRSSAANLPRVTLELGGNDAAIVMPDAELDKIMPSLFWASFRNAGQICIAAKRVYVPSGMLEEALGRYAELAGSVVLGHGLDEATQMGPINNRPQLARVMALTEDALARGGRLVAGGSPPDGDGLSRGLFFRPTVITDLDDGCPLVAEEQFGPVLPILPYDDVDEAVARANSVPFGLGGSVWGRNIARAEGVARRLRCGIAWVNAHMALDERFPFGGAPRTGIGRELGPEGLDEYLEHRVLWTRLQ